MPHQQLLAVDLAVALAGMFSAATSANMGQRHERRKRAAFVSVVQALGQIAERQPIVELQGAVPDLNALGRDILQETGEVRHASREAARRIEAATERLKSLPLPGGPAGGAAEALPRPSGASETENGALPLVPQGSMPGD
jgi:hypothetical protein